MKRLRAWWIARKRRLDILILWPICKNRAADLTQAKNAFVLHMSMDPLWSGLSARELAEVVDSLQ